MGVGKGWSFKKWPQIQARPELSAFLEKATESTVNRAGCGELGILRARRLDHVPIGLRERVMQLLLQSAASRAGPGRTAGQTWLAAAVATVCDVIKRGRVRLLDAGTWFPNCSNPCNSPWGRGCPLPT